MENKIIYTSDIHGNEKQFRTLVDYALDVKPSIVIIAGELLPKGGYRITDNYPQMQRAFLTERLPYLLRPIKDKLPDTQILVTPGNDDCKSNDDILNDYSNLFTNIDGKRVQLSKSLEIVGYSTVPITPFAIKDREKFDLTNVQEEVAVEYKKRQVNYNLRGIISINVGDGPRWRNIQFTDKDKTDSIQRDLENTIFTNNSERTVYIFHTPPNDTSLDVTGNERHVGSFAVKEFIERYQPYLTLHGHIHETVDMSGDFKSKIGKTWCMSAGNHNEDSKLSVLVLDLNNLINVKRVKLPCTSLGKLLNRIVK